MNPKRQRLRTVLGLAVLTAILPWTRHSSAQDYKQCQGSSRYCNRPLDCNLEDEWTSNDTYCATPKENYRCYDSLEPALCLEQSGGGDCGARLDCVSAAPVPNVAPCAPSERCLTIFDP